MTPPSTFKDVIREIIMLISAILPIISAFAVLSFVWGIAKFISKAGDSKSHAEGKTLMIWGLAILFVMVSFMGIIRLFYHDTFGGTLGFPLLPH